MSFIPGIYYHYSAYFLSEQPRENVSSCCSGRWLRFPRHHTQAQSSFPGQDRRCLHPKGKPRGRPEALSQPAGHCGRGGGLDRGSRPPGSGAGVGLLFQNFLSELHVSSAGCPRGRRKSITYTGKWPLWTPLLGAFPSRESAPGFAVETVNFEVRMLEFTSHGRCPGCVALGRFCLWINSLTSQTGTIHLRGSLWGVNALMSRKSSAGHPARSRTEGSFRHVHKAVAADVLASS